MPNCCFENFAETGMTPAGFRLLLSRRQKRIYNCLLVGKIIGIIFAFFTFILAVIPASPITSDDIWCTNRTKMQKEENCYRFIELPIILGAVMTLTNSIMLACFVKEFTKKYSWIGWIDSAITFLAVIGWFIVRTEIESGRKRMQDPKQMQQVVKPPGTWIAVELFCLLQSSILSSFIAGALIGYTIINSDYYRKNVAAWHGFPPTTSLEEGAIESTPMTTPNPEAPMTTTPTAYDQKSPIGKI